VSYIEKILVFVTIAASVTAAQVAPGAQQAKPGHPQVRVNYLNVCNPSEAERAEIGATLDRLPAKPHFATDYEIARGRSTMDESALIAAGEGAKMSDEPPTVARWVRVRKEFPENFPLSNVQYSFSVNGDKVLETLVFRSREQKDVIQVSLSDNVVAPPIPSQVVTTSTPVDRIRLERFGKSSLVLARCPTVDQAQYEPLFQKATTLLNIYRNALGVRRIVPQELPRAESSAQPKTKPAKPKTAH
jgi:hypothetical protein